MRVEFVGLPGAGKSVACASLAALLMAAGDGRKMRITVLADQQPRWLVQLQKVVDAIGFVVRHPRRTLRIFSIVADSSQRSPIAAATKTINLLAELRRSVAPSGSVSEQGVLQGIWSIGFAAGKPVIDDLIMLCAPWMPTVVVLVSVDDLENARRLQDRNNGRSRLDNAKVGLETLEHGRRLLSQIITQWRRLQPEGELIEIDNRQGTEPTELLRPHLPAIAKSYTK